MHLTETFISQILCNIPCIVTCKGHDTVLLYVPEFWYGGEQNSGEKERPSCMSQNFGMVGNKILVKIKNPPVPV